mmetsp:Transcript_3113/g.3681  ORF Transcript_3113/g.3681 Transcript_3113/m.3681 type:complete len:178 (-) Transcript_3113:3602-4135(-)
MGRNQVPMKYVTSITISSGRKKYTSLNLNSVNAKHMIPIVDERKDNVRGIVRNFIVWTTRSCALARVLGAEIKRCTTWTEYSTAKPMLKTKAMFEKAVRLTPTRILMPMTGITQRIDVIAISRPPTTLATTIFFALCPCGDIMSVTRRKSVATAKPTAMLVQVIVKSTVSTSRYCSQ